METPNIISHKAFVIFSVVLVLICGIAYLVFGGILEPSPSIDFWRDFAKGALIPSGLTIAYLALFTKSFRKPKK